MPCFGTAFNEPQQRFALERAERHRVFEPLGKERIRKGTPLGRGKRPALEQKAVFAYVHVVIPCGRVFCMKGIACVFFPVERTDVHAARLLSCEYHGDYTIRLRGRKARAGRSTAG